MREGWRDTSSRLLILTRQINVVDMEQIVLELPPPPLPPPVDPADGGETLADAEFEMLSLDLVPVADAEVEQIPLEPAQKVRKKQIQLGAMFGWSSCAKRITDEQLADHAAAETSMQMARSQIVAERLHEPDLDVGPPVKNGSRDRFGNLRSKVGGRPKKNDEDPKKRARANRKMPGEILRKEFPATELLRMIKDVKEKEEKFWEMHGPPAEMGTQERNFQERGLAGVWRSTWPSWTKKQIKALLRDEDRLKERVFKLKLAAGHKGETVQKGRRDSRLMPACRGMRAQGGGRKNKYLKFWAMVKSWHQFERIMGKTVDLEDVWVEFKSRVQNEIAILQILDEKTKLGSAGKVWLHEMTDRLQKLEGSSKYRETYLQRLCLWGQMSVGRPSRYTDLTPQQEQINWEITHQGFDYAQWLAAFGSADQLKAHIADVPKFCERRQETALIFTDQVPVWIKIGNKKVVFSAGDRCKKSSGSKKMTGGQKLPQMTQALQAVEQLSDQIAADGQSQTRGPQKSGDDKFRITLECRQAVLNWFGDEDPVGVILPSILVLWGVHCRLSNITADRRWKEDETIVIAGIEIHRKKGQKIPTGMMNDMLDLRDARPELLKDHVVMQQPSATVDEVIVGWCMEDLMTRFPQFVLQRDLVAGALSNSAKLAAKIAHAICSWIGPQMTPVAQLTDTDVAFILKSFMKRSKDRLIQQMKKRAQQSMDEVSFRCDAFEIATICAESHQALVQRNADTKLILKALRRNGQFAWRPDLAAGKLVKVDDQPWAAGMKMGSHRYPQTWLNSRYDWLDKDLVPIQPDWRRTLKHQQSLEDQPVEVAAEIAMKHFAKDQYSWDEDRFTHDYVVTVSGVEIKVPVLDLEFDEMGAMPKELEELLKVGYKDRDLKPVDELLQKKLCKKKMDMRSSESLSRMRLALCGFADELHAGLEADLKKKTRMEVFRKLKFVATSSKSSKKKALKGIKKNLSKMLKKKKVITYNGKLCVVHRLIRALSASSFAEVLYRGSHRALCRAAC